jgi:hypothetical protein
MRFPRSSPATSRKRKKDKAPKHQRYFGDLGETNVEGLESYGYVNEGGVDEAEDSGWSNSDSSAEEDADGDEEVEKKWKDERAKRKRKGLSYDLQREITMATQLSQSKGVNFFGDVPLDIWDSILSKMTAKQQPKVIAVLHKVAIGVLPLLGLIRSVHQI